MIKLVLSDVDGTIVPLGAGKVDGRTIDAIEDLQATGVRVGLATGRDVQELLNMFDGYDGALQTGILSNGQKLLVDGEIARLTLLDLDALERVARIVATYDETFMTLYPFETRPENPVYCINADPDHMARCEKRYSFTAIPIDHVPRVEAIGSTIACDLPQSVLDEIKERAAEACPELDFVQPSEHWCDIIPKGLNKGTALPELLRALDITADEVVVFGDAENDVSILSAVENSVVVADAMPAAKAAARWQIGPCADLAVAQALHEIARVAGTDELPAFMR